jgi:microcystin-dependent protein
MGDQYLAEIRIWAGNFAPQGWAFCNGQLLPIRQNTALFSLLGTTYGGDGVQTFALPNFQGRIPLHWGNGPGLTPYAPGAVTGSENVTLLSTQMPAHTHPAMASNAAAAEATPDNNLWAVPVDSTGTPGAGFNPSPANAALSPTAIGITGGSQPHSNVQPVLALTFIIALEGVFPSRG